MYKNNTYTSQKYKNISDSKKLKWVLLRFIQNKSYLQNKLKKKKNYLLSNMDLLLNSVKMLRNQIMQCVKKKSW